MIDISDADQQVAQAIVDAYTMEYYDTGALDCDPGKMSTAIAAALASERKRAHESFLPNNPDVGKVAFRVEAWPHDPGANGEAYHAGHAPASEAAQALRDIAEQIDGWADPECPWAGQEGHAPATPEQDNRAAEEAKARAYALRRASGGNTQ